jgi:Skp family chaperone for outer membrane proteins
MALDINNALILLAILTGCITAFSFRKEFRRRKTEILYAYGYAGRPTANMTFEEQEQEAIRVRNEVRKHMAEVGLPFDYSALDAKNEARRQEREAKREELLEEMELEWKKEQARLQREADLKQTEGRKEYIAPVINMNEYVEQRGISVLYPKGSHKHRPPEPPKSRRRYRKKDGTSTYQLGLDVSPVHGIKNSDTLADKSFQNTYEDDYPDNVERAYNKQMDIVYEERRQKAKEELLKKDYGIREYKANYQQWEEIRKRLNKAM